ncbi:MAG: TetR family transcriptional regulator [Candidatus Limnocylindrales bacterium]
MRRRAEQVDETRQRITEAAMRLHTSVGPSNTTLSGVAEAAGVTRLTVYRHFADLDALFVACMGHWSALNPTPDLEAWTRIESLPDRAGRAFRELYEWYAVRHEELYPIYRDRSAMPGSAQAAMTAQTDAMAAAIVPAEKPGGAVRRAVARHLVDFWTWRSLVVEGGLAVPSAAQAAVAMLLAVEA